MRRVRIWLAGALLALLIAACGAPQPPAETALVSDADLESAEMAPTSALSALVGSATDLDMVVGDIANRESLTGHSDFAPSGARSADAEDGDGPGYIAFVEERMVGNIRYSIRLTEASDPQRYGKLVYHGKHEIESVAVDEAGELMLFTADMGATGLDPFLLDLAGVLGEKRAVYALPATEFDETDVSMSLDGGVWAFGSFDALSQTTNYYVFFFDRSTGSITFRSFNITLGGEPIEQLDPSVSGDGAEVLFVADGPVVQDALGAQALVRFATDGSSGGIVYSGLAGLSTGLSDPSYSFDADAFLFQEVFAGTNYVSLIQQSTGAFFDLLAEEEPVDHPHLAADLSGFTFAVDGTVTRADLDLEALTLTFTEVPHAPPFRGFAPYWANPVPPPPPPPPGTIIYEGTTVGGPTFDRPEGLGPETVGPVNYHAYDFTAADTGVYDISSQQDYDGYLLLYSSPFDPSQPLLNLVAANDDLGNNRSSGFRLFLDAGEYVLVTTAWQHETATTPGGAGNFTNMIIPPQPADPAGPPEVQLFNLRQNLLAPGESTFIEWFVSSGTPITCEVDWGDDSIEAVPCQADPSGLESASHQYTADGHYVITFTATNENGATEAKAFPTVHTEDTENFDIVVVFANDLLSPTQMDAFQDAADRWAEVITGDLPAGQPGEVPADFSCLGEPAFNGFIDDVVVSAAGIPIDGAGGVLARAGFCVPRQSGTNGSLEPLPLYGAMQFDIADLDNLETGGGLHSTILHEMGHVLGIGTLWLGNDLVDFEPETANCREDTFTVPPTFTGTAAVTAFEAIGGSGGVPVEDEFGSGTQCSHWDEEALVNELMTGFLNTGAMEPLSVITVGSLADLGYEVDPAAADPFTVPAGLMAPASAPLGYDEVLLNIGKTR